jgi:tetratricopeptide (TPR) repeat protein
MAACPAQVAPVRGGDVLDANYQVGSGGYNTVVGGVGGVNSQLYVTGQVSGLAGFGAAVPYSAANQLRTDVPSASLGTFRRQSVGLPDVLAGQSYQTSPYYERTQTAFLLPGIRAGLAAPGSNAPPATSTPESVQQLWAEATRDYRNITRTANSGVGNVIPATQQPSAAPGVAGTGLVPAPENMLPTGPMIGLPGMISSPQSEQLARELYEQAVASGQITDTRATIETGGLPAMPSDRTESPREQPSRSAPGAAPGGPAGAPSGTSGASARPTPPNYIGTGTPGDSRAGSQIDARTGRQSSLLQPGGEISRGGSIARSGAAAQPPAARGAAGAAANLPAPNQDPYIDMLLEFRRERQPDRMLSGTGGITRTPAPQAPAGTAAPALPVPGGAVLPTGTASGLPAPAALDVKGRPIVERQGDGVVLHSLAGQRTDIFNQRMARGDAMLRDAKYYDAAAEYQAAVELNPTNPLPRLGLSVALFAAGEHNRAGFQLRKAMTLFPPIMETRLDIASLMQDKQLRGQLAEARDRLKEAKDPQPLLVLSLAYMYRTLGEDQVARELAQTLAQVAGDDAVAWAYSQYLLTGKRPSELPQGQPSGSVRQRNVDPESLRQHLGYRSVTSRPATGPATQPAAGPATQPAP